MPYCLTTMLSQCFKSDTCSHVKPSSLIAFIQASFESRLSSDTPNIVKFLSLSSLYALIRAGLFSRHDAHHEAQKSINTYLPRNDDSFTGFPEVSYWVKSGA